MDQVKQFQNELLSDTLTRRRIQPVLTSLKKLYGNLTERDKRDIGRLFRIYCHRRQSTWPEYTIIQTSILYFHILYLYKLVYNSLSSLLFRVTTLSDIGLSIILFLFSVLQIKLDFWKQPTKI